MDYLKGEILREIDRKYLKAVLQRFPKLLQEADRIFKDDLGTKYFYSNDLGDLQNSGDGRAYFEYPKARLRLEFSPQEMRALLQEIHKKH